MGGRRRSRALTSPRGQLESRIEGLVPDRSTELVLDPPANSRFPFPAQPGSRELGYDNVFSPIGGFTDWKCDGYRDRGAAQPSAPIKRPPLLAAIS